MKLSDLTWSEVSGMSAMNLVRDIGALRYFCLVDPYEPFNWKEDEITGFFDGIANGGRPVPSFLVSTVDNAGLVMVRPFRREIEANAGVGDPVSYRMEEFRSPDGPQQLYQDIKTKVGISIQRADPLDCLNEILTIPDFFDIARNTQGGSIFCGSTLDVADGTAHLRQKKFAHLTNDQQLTIRVFNRYFINAWFRRYAPIVDGRLDFINHSKCSFVYNRYHELQAIYTGCRGYSFYGKRLYYSLIPELGHFKMIEYNGDVMTLEGITYILFERALVVAREALAHRADMIKPLKKLINILKRSNSLLGYHLDHTPLREICEAMVPKLVASNLFKSKKKTTFQKRLKDVDMVFNKDITPKGLWLQSDMEK